jgi:hypothetical protein
MTKHAGRRPKKTQVREIKGLEKPWVRYYQRGPVQIRVHHIKNGTAKGHFEIATRGGTREEQERAVADIQECLIETMAAVDFRPAPAHDYSL